MKKKIVLMLFAVFLITAAANAGPTLLFEDFEDPVAGDDASVGIY